MEVSRVPGANRIDRQMRSANFSARARQLTPPVTEKWNRSRQNPRFQEDSESVQPVCSACSALQQDPRVLLLLA